MDKIKILSITKQLNGLSFLEWYKIKVVIDDLFNKKKRELEQELKLSDVDIQTIHEQFE